MKSTIRSFVNQYLLSKFGLAIYKTHFPKPCDNCKNKKFINYMIKNEIWYEILNLNDKNNLCLICLYKKLNRKPLSSDFTNVSVNRELIYLFK